MVNITEKSNSLRKAIATATVNVSKAETIQAIENNLVPKGDVFSFAKVAALFAIKKPAILYLIAILCLLNLQIFDFQSVSYQLRYLWKYIPFIKLEWK